MTEHPHIAIADAREKLVELGERIGADLLSCDRCGHPMVVRQTQVSADPCRNDIRIKCPTSDGEFDSILGIDLDGCGWWTRHGVPITREEYEEEMERRDRPLVDAVSTPWPEPAEPDDREERLRALGYIEP